MPARSRPCCDLGLFDLPLLRNFRTRCRSKVRKKTTPGAPLKTTTNKATGKSIKGAHPRSNFHQVLQPNALLSLFSFPIDFPPTLTNTYHLLLPTMQAFGGTNEVLSWTSEDPRQSSLFGPWGVVYRFQVTLLCPPYCWATVSLTIRQTDVNRGTTTLYRSTRANKEDRVARLEWGPNGGLGRAVIGKVGVTFRPSY